MKDEASLALLLRILAGFMILIAFMGCFVIVLSSGILFWGVATPFTILGVAGLILFAWSWFPPIKSKKQ
jgi:hypothetical protein